MGDTNLQRNDLSWDHLHRMVQLQFPHSIMYGLRVREGAAVSYEGIEFTRVFTRETVLEDRAVPESLSEPWRRLIRFCRQVQDAVLAEIHFRAGSPQHVLMKRPGDTFEAARTVNTGDSMTQQTAAEA